MATPTCLSLVLASVFLLSNPAHSATPPVAAPDPCLQRSELPTRDKILAAFPGKNDLWAQTLNKRGIAKVGTEWLQYFSGGSATASNAAFTRALEDYCTERIRAGQRAAADAETLKRDAARREKDKAEREARFTTVAATKHVDVTKKSLTIAEGIKKLFTAENDDKFTEAPAPMPASADQCQQWRLAAENCQAAGMVTESVSGYGLATEAKCARAIANDASCRNN